MCLDRTLDAFLLGQLAVPFFLEHCVHLPLSISSAATGSIGAGCAAGRTHGAARFASSSEHFGHLQIILYQKWYI